jgi:hypothetical protein
MVLAIFGLFFRFLLLLTLVRVCPVLFCSAVSCFLGSHPSCPPEHAADAATVYCWCRYCCCCRTARPDVCQSGRVSGAAVAPPALLSSRLCSALFGGGLRWLDLAPPRRVSGSRPPTERSLAGVNYVDNLGFFSFF